MTGAGSAPAPLRVWLEPGYDHGRFGTWLLDLPGAFSWDLSRERAMSQAPAVAGRFRAWLEEHGEVLAFPSIEGTELVEEIAPTWRDDGYERNATFAADRRPVAAAEIDALERRLGFARADLLALAARIRAHEAVQGPLSRHGGDRTERSAGHVLRHIAGAEAWLAGRLDPGARYEGPGREGEVGAFLEGSRAWALAKIRELHGRGDLEERVDGKGETWTLAKVVRRLLYHSLDHFFELELRLARADRTIERLTFGERPALEALVRLLRTVGWDHRAAEPDSLARAVEGSRDVVSVRDGERLVGFARTISDGAWNAYISTVIVDPRYQGIGVAGGMLARLLEGHDDMRFGLTAMDGLEGFYARFGFEPNPRSMVRRRRR